MFTSAGCVIAAVFIVSLLVLIAALYAERRRAPPGRADSFYTSAATEEPTRAETPYVGTVPLGPWGVLPWALGPGVSRSGAAASAGPL